MPRWRRCSRYLDGQRFRGVYALHAALIADQAGRTADAARLYHAAQTEFGGMNLRLAQILASWDVRHGHAGGGQRMLAAMADERRRWRSRCRD